MDRDQELGCWRRCCILPLYEGTLPHWNTTSHASVWHMVLGPAAGVGTGGGGAAMACSQISSSLATRAPAGVQDMTLGPLLEWAPAVVR